MAGGWRSMIMHATWVACNIEGRELVVRCVAGTLSVVSPMSR